jgi:hypothetical protein
MNDDQFSLASAYLDGDLTADERARVESEPELLALVDRLRVLAADVGTVEPPDAGRRDRAINAALAVFDEAPEANGVVTRESSVAPLPVRRSVAAQWLSVAAMVLVVGVLGTVAFSALSGRTGNDTDDGVDGTASQMADNESVRRSVTDDGGVAESMSDAAPADMGDDPFALSPAQAPDGADDAADDADADADADAGIATASAIMRSPADLADFAGSMLDTASRADDGGSSTDSPCPGTGDVVGFGVYGDRPVFVTVGADPVEPFVTLAPGAIIVSAVDTATCDVAAQTVLDQGD